MQGNDFCPVQTIQLPDAEEVIKVPISSAASLNTGKGAMAISHCDPGILLDLTRGLEIWVFVNLEESDQMANTDSVLSSDSWLKIDGGFGVGKFESDGQICISEFAEKLLYLNLLSFRKHGKLLKLEIIFPAGRDLAQRTSNRAFGVVDGLALIGTQAEVQVSASPDQLQNAIRNLRDQCSRKNFAGNLTFVIGENGLDLALKAGFNAFPIIKTGNWLGPLLVAAAEEGVKQLVIVGYHGKLIKLAGGIFHTHNHLADSRLEILVALAVKEGISFELIKSLGQCVSIQDALLMLEQNDLTSAKKLWLRIAREVEERSQVYVNRYIASSMKIGVVLFDRERRLRWAGPLGLQNIHSLDVTLQD